MTGCRSPADYDLLGEDDSHDVASGPRSFLLVYDLSAHEATVVHRLQLPISAYFGTVLIHSMVVPGPKPLGGIKDWDTYFSVDGNNRIHCVLTDHLTASLPGLFYMSIKIEELRKLLRTLPVTADNGFTRWQDWTRGIVELSHAKRPVALSSFCFSDHPWFDYQ